MRPLATSSARIAKQVSDTVRSDVAAPHSFPRTHTHTHSLSPVCVYIICSAAPPPRHRGQDDTVNGQVPRRAGRLQGPVHARAQAGAGQDRECRRVQSRASLRRHHRARYATCLTDETSDRICCGHFTPLHSACTPHTNTMMMLTFFITFMHCVVLWCVSQDLPLPTFTT